MALIYPKWLVFEIQYRKVCQDVNISLNLCYKPTFYDMRFRRYTIVAKPYLTFVASLKSCSGHPHACSRVFPQRVYLCLSYAKSFFYSKNLKSISTFWLHYNTILSSCSFKGLMFMLEIIFSNLRVIHLWHSQKSKTFKPTSPTLFKHPILDIPPQTLLIGIEYSTPENDVSGFSLKT